MNKLITINEEFKHPKGWHLLYALYNDLIIHYSIVTPNTGDKCRSEIKFFNVLTHEYLWEDFDPKMSDNIYAMYVNNNRLILIGNGRCKIFDLLNNLKEIKNIKYSKVNRCYFSGDGNTILLRNDVYKIRLINLITSKIIDDSDADKKDTMIIGDKLYRYDKNKHNYEILDFDFNVIGYRFPKNNILMNKDSRYDYHYRASESYLEITDKLSNVNFYVYYSNYYKRSNNERIDIFDNILVTRNFNSGTVQEYHLFKIKFNEQDCDYLGVITCKALYYIGNNLFLTRNIHGGYSIYSTKGD